MDPFHDNPLHELSGFPDAVVTPSIIRIVKQSLEVNAASPDGDIYLNVNPWNGTADLANYLQSANTIALPGTTAISVPQVAIHYTNPGVGPDYRLAPGLGLSYPNPMQAGKGRLIGMGVEWINTTAPINRSGTLYCWRQPGTQDNVESVQYLTGAVVSRVGSVKRTSTPALNVASVMNIPGTRSWAAEEGCYMVVPFAADNPPLYPTTTAPLFNSQPALVPIQVRNANINAPVVTGTATAASTSYRLVPIDTIGMVMTGTGPLFKSTVNVIWYYEEFPDEQSDVLTLATPSCEYDSTALQLYCSVMNTLPVGVPSSWNAAGDWWWEVVSAIKDHAKTLGGLLGGKPGEAVGMAASTVAGWGRDRYLTSPGSGGSSVPRRPAGNGGVRQQTLIVAPAKRAPRKRKPKPKPQVQINVATKAKLDQRQKRELAAYGRALASMPGFNV